MNINFRKEVKGDPNSMNLYTVFRESVFRESEIEIWRADDYAHLMAQLTRAGIDVDNTLLDELAKVLTN